MDYCTLSLTSKLKYLNENINLQSTIPLIIRHDIIFFQGMTIKVSTLHLIKAQQRKTLNSKLDNLAKLSSLSEVLNRVSMSALSIPNI